MVPSSPRCATVSSAPPGLRINPYRAGMAIKPHKRNPRSTTGRSRVNASHRPSFSLQALHAARTILGPLPLKSRRPSSRLATPLIDQPECRDKHRPGHGNFRQCPRHHAASPLLQKPLMGRRHGPEHRRPRKRIESSRHHPTQDTLTHTPLPIQAREDSSRPGAPPHGGRHRRDDTHSEFARPLARRVRVPKAVGPQRERANRQERRDPVPRTRHEKRLGRRPRLRHPREESRRIPTHGDRYRHGPYHVHPTTNRHKPTMGMMKWRDHGPEWLSIRFVISSALL